MSFLVVDSYFPHISETFRDEEYLYYIHKLDAHFLNVSATINWNMANKLNIATNGLFGKNFKQKLQQKYSFAYSIGLCLTYSYYKAFYKPLSIPFIFTLYPGFCFCPTEDEQPVIKELVESPLCKSVIVTQPTTLDCLKKHNLNYKTTYINGVPVADFYLSCETQQRTNTKKKICFVAFNSNRKGFLEFVEVCDILNTHFQDQFEWHVIGDWPKDRQFIQYHGIQSKEFLLNFYKTVDAVVAPIKYVGGELDGFPTTSSLEAGATGCALLLTDTHNQNECFEEGEWLKIDSNPQNIADTIIKYKDRFGEIGMQGQNKIKKFYSFENQILPRYTLIKSHLDKV